VMQAWVSHFVIAPPLIVTNEELDRGIGALDQHLSIADALVVPDTGGSDSTSATSDS
jgi:taurine--2-oxoglutarate transaminase